jgi:hypothetical protein
MAILAAGKSEYDFLIYIAAAIWGIISWIRNRNASEPPTPTAQGPLPTQQRTEPRPTQRGESEEERLRKFLEALGVPANQPPPQPVQRPKPAPQPAPVRQPTVPRQMERPVPRQMVPRQPQPIAPKKQAPKPLIKETDEMPLAGRLEEPAHSVEQVGADFDQMAKGIAMAPMEEVPRASEVGAFTSVRVEAVSGTALRNSLKSPEALRAALVMREILGPPRCEAI